MEDYKKMREQYDRIKAEQQEKDDATAYERGRLAGIEEGRAALAALLHPTKIAAVYEHLIGGSAIDEHGPFFNGEGDGPIFVRKLNEQAVRAVVEHIVDAAKKEKP